MSSRLYCKHTRITRGSWAGNWVLTRWRTCETVYSEMNHLLRSKHVSAIRWVKGVIADVQVQAPLYSKIGARLVRWTNRPWPATLLFFAVLLLVFQAVFTWATPMMDVIDSASSALGRMIVAQVGGECHQQLPGRRGYCRCWKCHHISAPDSDPVSVYHYSRRHRLPGANFFSDGSCHADCRTFRSIRHPDAFQFRMRCTIDYGNPCHSGSKRPYSNDSRSTVYDLFSKTPDLCLVDRGICSQSVSGLDESAGAGTFWALSSGNSGWPWHGPVA